jgi:hypothetical protein
VQRAIQVVVVHKAKQLDRLRLRSSRTAESAITFCKSRVSDGKLLEM